MTSRIVKQTARETRDAYLARVARPDNAILHRMDRAVAREERSADVTPECPSSFHPDACPAPCPAGNVG